MLELNLEVFRMNKINKPSGVLRIWMRGTPGDIVGKSRLGVHCILHALSYKQINVIHA